MTTFVVLGDQPVAGKLLTATMNDYLETHQEVSPDEDFCVVIATRKKATASLQAMMTWCDKAGVWYEVVTPPGVEIPEGASSYIESDNFLIDAVEAGYSYSSNSAVVLALVGEKEPKVDVARALVRAADSHMVIRDLTEGALTYIKFHGDTVGTPPLEDAVMAEDTEEVTLEDLTALAEEGDEEAVEALDEAAREYGIDPDDYEDWAGVGAALGEAMEEEEEEVEEEDPAGGWTEEALKGKTLKEVREIAVAAGIEGAKTTPRVKLVKALIEGEVEEEEVEEEKPAPKKKAAAKKSAAKKTAAKAEAEEAPAAVADIDYDQLALAIVSALAAQLSK